MLDALNKLKRDFYARDDPWSKEPIRNSTMYRTGEQLGVKFNHLLEVDPIFLEYATHPRIVGMCEEVLGNAARINETQAVINSRKKADRYGGPGRYQWHRHRPEIINYTFNGLYHTHFVKAITNLTELGPDDGGTCVIAGCHKATCREEGIVKAAREDRMAPRRTVPTRRLRRDDDAWRGQTDHRLLSRLRSGGASNKGRKGSPELVPVIVS